MEPITTPGTANYAITVPQQNTQENYSTMPMVYDPAIEEKKSASSNMLGMTALGIIAALGVGYGVSKGKKVSGLKQQIAQLSAEKDAALKLKDEAVKLKDEANKALDKERTLTGWQRFKRLFNPNSGLTKEEQDARIAAKKAKKEAAKAEKNTVKETKTTENTETKPDKGNDK